MPGAAGEGDTRVTVDEAATEWRNVEARLCFTRTLDVVCCFEDPSQINVCLQASDARVVGCAVLDVEEVLPSAGVVTVLMSGQTRVGRARQ